MNGKGYFHYLTQALLGRIKDAPPALPVLPNGLVVITLTSSLPGVGKTLTAAWLEAHLEAEGARVKVVNVSRVVALPTQANGWNGLSEWDRLDIMAKNYQYLILDVDAG